MQSWTKRATFRWDFGRIVFCISLQQIWIHYFASHIRTDNRHKRVFKHSLFLYQPKQILVSVWNNCSPNIWGDVGAKTFERNRSELQRPDKATDPNYTGEYDFWYNNIKIEVKASRAVKRQSGGRLIEKALSIEDNASFDMNFQQLKPDCCDVFVWIGVWKDCIKYWVLSNEEVRSNKYFSKGQHRGNKQKEGQLWIKNSNIDDFNPYAVDVRHILDKIIEKSNQNTHCHE